ncbi:hypothetical protein C1H46_019497 [Malus baccata]|uniref:Alliinase C-terminal domain-containing protein n=1 Tax=Malus baccata TaxID=106549 RepID=A0A540M846_MALBA|nr:hypothetical protein C1H46_019497 [Malus baccata]
MVMQKSKDSQQRAVKMMGVICDGYENCKSTDNSKLFFDHCHQIMGNRWERLRKMVEKSEFTFKELKSATGNFRPDCILGKGGFGYVNKWRIEENGTGPAKLGSGITVAIKSLKPDGLQGHRT